MSNPPSFVIGRGRLFLQDLGLLFMGWTAVALVFSAGYSLVDADGYTLSSGYLTSYAGFLGRLGHFLPFYWLWAVLTPIVLFAARQLRGALRWPAAVPAHLALSIAIAFVHVGLYVAVVRVIEPHWSNGSYPAHFRAGFIRHGPPDVLVYACIVGLWLVHDFRRRSLDEIAELRLEALRRQLHPHFLFNTLQTATSLIGREPSKAEEMLENLGDFLRAVLRRDGPNLIPLREEIDLLDHYLKIMKARFGDRLTIRVVVEPAAREALVPVLVLQPVVENALEHGVAQRSAAGLVEVSANVVNDRLLLRVSDDGAGMAASGAVVGRVGLTNTRARLRELFGDDFAMRMQNRVGSPGFEVEVDMPFRPCVSHSTAVSSERAPILAQRSSPRIERR